MRLIVVLGLTVLMLLAGCGQTGPLYLPEAQPPADTGERQNPTDTEQDLQ